MAKWIPACPVDFTPEGDRTNQAIQKHITEIARIYDMIHVLRQNFVGAGFPSSPERNQLFINPNTLEAFTYVGLSGENDWRTIVTQSKKHTLDNHFSGTMADLQQLITDAFLLFLSSVPAPADNGKVLMVNASGGVALSADATPKTHGSSKHSAEALSALQSKVTDASLVALATAPTSGDSAKLIGIDSTGKYILVTPAAQTDALDAPYELVKVHGSLTTDTTLAASDGNIHTFTVGGAISLTLNSNCLTGYCRTLTLVITNGGAYTITWPTAVKWADGTAPTFTASGVDIVTLVTVDAGTTWYGSANGVSYA